MERLFPAKIHSVVVNVNLGPLQTLIKCRQVDKFFGSLRIVLFIALQSFDP